MTNDTGLGGSRYIETTFSLKSFLVIRKCTIFYLRCRADVPIKVEPDNSGTLEAKAFVESLQQYKPKQEAFFIFTRVNTKYGESDNIFDVFKLDAHKPGDTIYLPLLGPGKYHEFPVTVELSLKVFEAGIELEP